MTDTKITLPESDIPTHFYNIAPDLPTPLPPPLHPGDARADRPRGARADLPDGAHPAGGLAGAGRSRSPTRCATSTGCTGRRPVFRARALEEALDTPAQIYYKSEHVSPVGSHKLNTALMQAWVNKQEGVKRLATETGAGQWGSALACACQLMGLECMVYMVRVSYDQKPYRRIMMKTYGADVVASPSNADRRRAARSWPSTPTRPAASGIAISEAVEDAAQRDDTKYALGSVLNHVLLHQTIIGQEAQEADGARRRLPRHRHRLPRRRQQLRAAWRSRSCRTS